MTYWLFGTIICTTLFVLTRYTNLNVLEKVTEFQKSPNISKVDVIPVVDDTRVKDNKGIGNVQKTNELHRTDAVSILNEILTRASTAASKNKLQQKFEQSTF